MNKFFTFPLALPFFIALLLLPFISLSLVALLGFSAANIVEIALGLSPVEALVIYLAILAGGVINIPVYEFKSPGSTRPPAMPYPGARYRLPSWTGHRTVMAVNLGGCILSAGLGVYFALSLPPAPLLFTTIIVLLGVFYFARPVRSAGVMVPALATPLLAVCASLLALYIDGTGYPGLARMSFASGAFGTLIGAYLLRFPGIRNAGPDFVSIGGAGTFDGVLLTGIIATILAAALAGI